MNRIEESAHLRVIFMQQVDQSAKKHLLNQLLEIAIKEMAVDLTTLCRNAIEDNDLPDHIINKIIHAYAMLDSASVDIAKKFVSGRKIGALGTVAKKIKKYLEKHPEANTNDVWEALKKSPPKGHAFMENVAYGKYIEEGPKTVMKWPRFCNIVSQLRPKK